MLQVMCYIFAWCVLGHYNLFMERIRLILLEEGNLLSRGTELA